MGEKKSDKTQFLGLVDEDLDIMVLIADAFSQIEDAAVPVTQHRPRSSLFVA